MRPDDGYGSGMSVVVPNQYTSLSECVRALEEEGYTEEFQIAGSGLLTKQQPFDREEFQVDSYHRFEGASDPADMSVVYAISNTRTGAKGLLVSAYGSEACTLIHRLLRYVAPTHGSWLEGKVEPVQPIEPGANVKIE